MSSFFDYDKEKTNGFGISIIFVFLVFIIPKYIDIFFSKGSTQNNIPNFSKILFSSSSANNTLLVNLTENEFMNNSTFLTPTNILISLTIFLVFQYYFQYAALKNKCPEKMKNKSVVPIFVPLMILFLLLIFGSTSDNFRMYTVSLNIGFSFLSIIYFILFTQLYYKWDTSSWLAPIVSIIIGFIIKFAFDYGIGPTSEYLIWFLLFWVFIMGMNLYSSYYSYSLAINQQKICKII